MTFRIGIFADLLDSAGQPVFGSRPLDLVSAEPGVEWQWIEGRYAEITPDLAAAYDGLLVNLQKVTRTTVSGPV